MFAEELRARVSSTPFAVQGQAVRLTVSIGVASSVCGLETVPAEQHKKGVNPPKNETHVDHVVPRAKGGTNEPENGQVLCRECNIKKGDNEQ